MVGSLEVTNARLLEVKGSNLEDVQLLAFQALLNVTCMHIFKIGNIQTEQLSITINIRCFLKAHMT